MDDNMQFTNSDQNQYWYGSEQQDADPIVANEEPVPFTASVPPPSPPFPDYQYPGQQQYRRSRSPLWIILVLAVLLLIGGGVTGFLLLRTMHGTPQTQSNSNGTSAQIQAHGQLTLSVTSHPTVIIENDAGFIHVKTGSASNMVTLQLGQSSNGSSNSGNGTIPYTETSDHSTIILSLSPPDGSDLTVTVPATSDLKLHTNDGEIMVDGVSGQMNLVSNTGSVTVTHSTINSASILNDNTGAINATQDMLQGHVTLSNNSGSITFSGSIDPLGICTLQDNGGTVDMSLPATSSFHLDVTGNIDTFTTDFLGIPMQNAAFGPGEIHTNVGHDPGATLSIDLNGGPAVLHKQ
jgi:hypothetical protein